jgi:hypothetical protein
MDIVFPIGKTASRISFRPDIRHFPFPHPITFRFEEPIMTDKQNPKDSPASPAPKTAADPQAAEAPQSRSLAANTRLSELTIDDLNSIISAEASKAIASRLANQGGLAGSHVNSGPPGFVNGGGHANFDPARNIGSRVNVGDAGRAGVHVNSGPPGFVNGGGHANFDPARNIGSRVNVGDLGRAGSHVNSGPPGFVNGGGHANFDPRTSTAAFINVTLPDGGQVAIPATGPVDLHVRGFHITR